MIMLIGLVTKNGILIVEFANQKREEGLSRMDAVLEASRLRLRPILMTSLTMALGSLPLALSIGAACLQSSAVRHRDCWWHSVFTDTYIICNPFHVHLFIASAETR